MDVPGLTILARHLFPTVAHRCHLKTLKASLEPGSTAHLLSEPWSVKAGSRWRQSKGVNMNQYEPIWTNMDQYHPIPIGQYRQSVWLNWSIGHRHSCLDGDIGLAGRKDYDQTYSHSVLRVYSYRTCPCTMAVWFLEVVLECSRFFGNRAPLKNGVDVIHF